MTTTIIKTPSEKELHECSLPTVFRKYNTEYPHGTLIECDICHSVFASNWDGDTSFRHTWRYKMWESIKAQKKANREQKK